ncbi:Protein EXECUTER 1, chloroplastic [Linum perenne]
MASISAPTPPPRNLIFQSSHRHPKRRRSSLSPSPPFPSSSRFSDSHLCRCTNSSSSSSSDNQGWRWDAVIQDVFKSAIKTFDSYFGKRPWDGLDNGDFVETASRERGDEQRGAQEWDWDRWKKHFEDIDDQERLVSVLKSQLRSAVNSEDYEDASRIKVAIAAATTNDTVGEVMRNLLKAVAEERYQEAAFLRDHAGAGLVGWWSGISDEVCDPHGLIIRITAEHGRYVARSYSPRQLATATAGVPLFEIFLIMNKKGEYKQQAVYLKRKKQPQDPSMLSSIASSSLSRTGPTEEKDDLFVVTADETEDDDDTEDGFDPVDGFPGFNNIFRDMIPGVKVKVLKVTMPSKMDRDFIAKVIEDEEDEEEEDEDDEDESSEGEDDIKGESEEERDEIDVDAASEMIDNVGHGEISIKVMVGGLAQKSSPSLRGEDRVRVPAKLERKGRMSFCLSIEKETKRQDAGAKELASAEKQGKLQGQRSLDQVMLDLAKFIGKEKIPLKVLKDLSELLSVSLSQAQNRQPLSGSTTFHRIDASASPDPLSGLYIGARGLYTSEVIHLQRKVGQWQDNSGSNSKEASRLEFYEYVEAVKLTGDPYVPAGEVAFRAKVGKRYQLPHKGIIPEEFGVIARYKGQGRLADPGFGNPRWVDGELVILDGKYVKGGPIIGFVYWAPEYHFLVFFNRLRLP